jgi:LuxR family maltose regulon positive regulatory protein
LEQHDSFTFVDVEGSFTARKSIVRTGGSYWKAYCKRQGKLYRIHLGYSDKLTLEKLQAAARTFAGNGNSEKRPEISSTRSNSARPSLHLASRKVPAVDRVITPIPGKLYGPRNRKDLILRERLLERLNSGLSCRMTLVSAPAGFGKTTLISQWAQSINLPTVWLSLDVRDDDLRNFVRSLATALQSVFPDAFYGLANLCEMTRFPAVEHVVSMFLNDLADTPEDFILVLDDYHLIRNREIHTSLDQLFELLPLQLHLVLVTRSDPPLPIHRWRVNGVLNDVRPADLRFTQEETEAFLNHELGKRITHETAVSLKEQTGGWIALLRLFALSLSNASDVAVFMNQLQNYPDHSIQSYLVEEVLNQFEPNVQDVLVKVSLLEQFCVELCMDMTDGEISLQRVQSILDVLERSNVFIVPLDERKGWYRFHHLFGQLLKQRLLRLSSVEEINTLHSRASAWYAEQGLVELAIEHALEAGDVSGATRLVETRFFPSFEQEQLVKINHWLHLLPEEQIQNSPLLLVAEAWHLQNRGQLTGIPRLLTIAGQLLVVNGNSTDDIDYSQYRLLQALISILWSQVQFFAGQIQASLESARSALERLQESDIYVESFALLFQAWSLQAIGQEDIALATLNEGLRERATHLAGTARLLLAQAWLFLSAGKLHQVELTARHLLQVALESKIALSSNFAHWFLGVVYYEWNNLDAAIYHFSAVIADQHQAHFWVVEDALRGLALAYQAQGLDSQAKESSRTLLESVQEQHNIDGLMTAYAFCGRLALLQGDEERAEQWLEMAGEQQVRGPMPFLEDPPITKAWLLLAKGDEESVAHGQSLLINLLQHVEAMHDTRKTIKVLALQAWAYHLQGREGDAIDVLERALALARPSGFIRTFADVQALGKVLHVLRKRRKSLQEIDRKIDIYIQQILTAMNSSTVPPVSTDALLQQEGLEHLTDSELRILRLLEMDLTNKEIAQRLVVTTGTVKVHISNVYRKLCVNNRRAAVSLARTLGLLPASHTAQSQSF